MAFKTDTFIIKGMRQDASEAVFDTAFAFANKNIRIDARDNNTTLCVTQEKGNEQILRIELYNDLEYNIFDSVLNALPFTVIGHCELDNYCILFGIDNVQKDIIARLELHNNIFKLVYLYKGALLHFDIQHPIECLPNIETQQIKKVYFVDGKNNPRAINILKQYDANDMGDISLGFALQLNENFTVNKIWNVDGHYPAGKVQFAFSYYNDQQTETNLVEVTPMYDCTGLHQAISADSPNTSEHSFRLTIDNLDTQYQFLRVYMFFFSSSQQPVIRYIERYYGDATTWSDRLDYDEFDLIDYTGTYSDLMAKSSNIVPYTLATKDNYLFYGNIKEGAPDISKIQFESKDFKLSFAKKYIGKETFQQNLMYQYDPLNTTFQNSNYEYKGYRKGNWYRFGLIAQHTSGIWSNVIFLTDKQCNISSGSQVIYNDNHIPQEVQYYIPKAEVFFSNTGIIKLKQLWQLGYRKIKPVCVIPPPKYRNIVTQGIVCPTMYNGANRQSIQKLERNNFAFPSYFYRPKPLHNPYSTNDDGVLSVDYTYTMRSLKDLRNVLNYKDGVKYFANPEMDKVVTWQTPYREYRHGFSLPPKNTLNAEFNGSHINLNDYCFFDYLNSNVSSLFKNEAAQNMIWQKYDANEPIAWFSTKTAKWDHQVPFAFSSNASERDKVFQIQGYTNVPQKLYTNNYHNTIFIDESAFTINSPEVDFKDLIPTYATEWLNQCDVEICGYAQVTASLLRSNAAKGKYTGNHEHYLNGKCVESEHLTSVLESNTSLNDLHDILCKTGTQNAVLSYHTGPFWFTPIATFKLRGTNGRYDTNPIISNVYGEYYTNSDFNFWNVEDYYNGLSAISEIKNARLLCKTHFAEHDQLELTWSWYGELQKRKNEDAEIIVDNDGMLLYELRNNDKPHLLVASDLYIDKGAAANFNLTNVHHTFLRRILTLSGITLKTTHTDYNWLYNPSLIVHAADQTESTINGYNINVLPDPNGRWDYGWDIQTNNTKNELLGYCLGYYNFYPFMWLSNTYSLTVLRPLILPTAIQWNQWFHPNTTTQVVADNACLTNNKYTSHYYFPYSTTFPHSVFDPYYACAIYPWMGTQPFYSYNSQDGITYKRSLYNSTCSILYSNVTNYVTPQIINTNIQLYDGEQNGSAQLTFDKIKWLKLTNHGDLILNYGVFENAVSYTTTPLIAAMKWYRGFKNLNPQSNVHENAAANGEILTLPAVRDNLAFSGMLPQLFTKCGYLPLIRFVYTTLKELIPDVSRIAITTSWQNLYEKYRSQILQSVEDITIFNHHPAPHLIAISNSHCDLLPDFQTTIPITNHLNNTTIGSSTSITQIASRKTQTSWDYSNAIRYQPEFYYKIYFNEFLQHYLTHPDEFQLRYRLDNSTSFIVSNEPHNNLSNIGPYFSIYPHTGDWKDVAFPVLTNFNRVELNQLAYWQYCLNQNDSFVDVTRAHPRRNTIQVDLNDQQLLTYDEQGQKRLTENYWLLQLANVRNTQLEQEYGTNNPYTYEGLSVGQWQWQPCGYSISLNELIYNTHTILPNSSHIQREQVITNTVDFLEGDTYFQRYNSIKTYGHLNQNRKNDISEVGSVMIESYINLDGNTLLHDNLIGADLNNPYLGFPGADLLSSVNPVYSLSSNTLQTYQQIDYNYAASLLTHYPTRIMWSIHKINGESTDSWGIVPALNYYDTLGTCGDVEKLISFNDNVYCLQQHGLSVLDFNSKSLLETSTGNPISIYFQEALRLQNNTYFSRDVGTLNKWSVVNTKTGFYWIDETLKSFYRFPASGESLSPLDLSLSKGFKSWSNNQFAVKVNNIWNPLQTDNNWVANYDFRNNDIYWMNDKYCINYNETFDCFVSFYSYEHVPYMFNYFDQTYALNYNNRQTELYQQFANYKHQLFNQDVDNYVELLINTAPTYDKIFNFIEYTNECFDSNGNLIPIKNSYHKLSATNAYQNGTLTFNFNNTKQKFRVWRTEIPRDNTHPLDRIRGPWCKLKLERDPLIDRVEYRDQLHYISVNYTIPEQPMKTNISD